MTDERARMLKEAMLMRHKDYYQETAKHCWTLYNEFINVGFNDDQAFGLLMTVIEINNKKGH